MLFCHLRTECHISSVINESVGRRCTNQGLWIEGRLS